MIGLLEQIFDKGGIYMRIMPFMKRKKGVQFAGVGLDTGGGGTTDYDELSNKPQIGGVTLTGNKTLGDIGAQSVLTFDNVPTANSDNPVKSGGVASELSALNSKLVLRKLHSANTIEVVFTNGVADVPWSALDQLSYSIERSAGSPLVSSETIPCYASGIFQDTGYRVACNDTSFNGALNIQLWGLVIENK